MKFSFRSPAIDSVKIIIVTWVTMISAIIINVGISTHRDLIVSSYVHAFLDIYWYASINSSFYVLF